MPRLTPHGDPSHLGHLDPGRRGRRRRLVGAVMVCGLFLAACGGDGGGESGLYFVALTEMTELADVWENEVGGIKDEYVDDFQRLLGVVAGDPAASAAQYSREQCPDPDGVLRAFFGDDGGPLAAPTGDESPPETAAGVPAEVRTVLDDGPVGTYEQVSFDRSTSPR